MINPTFVSRSVNEYCYGNRFLRESAKIGIPHLHSVRWYSTTDGRIATWMYEIVANVCRMVVLLTPVLFLRSLLDFFQEKTKPQKFGVDRIGNRYEV